MFADCTVYYPLSPLDTFRCPNPGCGPGAEADQLRGRSECRAAGRPSHCGAPRYGGSISYKFGNIQYKYTMIQGSFLEGSQPQKFRGTNPQ